MIDDVVGASSSGAPAGINDSFIQAAKTAVDKTALVYALRLLSARGHTVDALVGLAKDYNASRARPEYRVETFIIENGKSGFSVVYVNTGEVKPKEPYPILPVI